MSSLHRSVQQSISVEDARSDRHIPASHKDDHNADDDAADTNSKACDDAQLLVLTAPVPGTCYKMETK